MINKAVFNRAMQHSIIFSIQQQHFLKGIHDFLHMIICLLSAEANRLSSLLKPKETTASE